MDESKATEFSTNASGVINFTRLGAGTYTVKETQVPTGYFSFVKPSFTLKITDDGHVTITGKDQPGLTGTVTNADGVSGPVPAGRPLPQHRRPGVHRHRHGLQRLR